MLTRLRVRNFKMFEELDIELGERVVLIGPNNSGKTTAMQALALWDAGLRAWLARTARRGNRRQRGVSLSRVDLTAVPVPDTRALWHQLKIRNSRMVGDKQQNENIRIEIIVSGETGDHSWECGLEFDYATDQLLYCRPLRVQNANGDGRMEVPEAATAMGVRLLPPMSGLLGSELRIDEGAINVRIGEGRTAEILRNLCYGLFNSDSESWRALVERMQDQFGVQLMEPQYIKGRGEIDMSYQAGGVPLDISASGRGFQQMLLLLAYLYAHPRSVLLLDEPDAHLEVLRQREGYDVIARTASDLGSQIIAASHSEVVLSEGIQRGSVVAFIGKPHNLDNQGSQLRKALIEIGTDQYAQAEQTGWVFYLEGSTDLSMLRSFARRLNHQRAQAALARPFIGEVGNIAKAARSHFYGLREAVPHLRAVALFDRLEKGPPKFRDASVLMWSRNEIENYICSYTALEEYARATTVAGDEAPDTLFGAAAARDRVAAMHEAISTLGISLEQLMSGPPLSVNIKASELVLEPLFKTYFSKLGLYNRMAKRNFHELVQYMPIEEIDPEVTEKLDAIADVAESTTPADL